MIAPIYSLAVLLIRFWIFLKSLFYPGYKEWRNQRNLDFVLNALPDQENVIRNRVWVHCASMGEYYMIRPVLANLKNSDLDTIIYLSFFSPSGYNNISDPSLIDYKFYLPSDTNHNANTLINKIKPHLFIGVKYEYWWKLLFHLENEGIPIVYTNVNLDKKPGYFNFLLKKYKRIYSGFDQIFVQYPIAKKILNRSGIENVTVSGDLRFDDVVEKTINPGKLNLKKNNKKVFVWGSVHAYEAKFINEVIHGLPGYVHIIVPHEVDIHNIDHIKSILRITLKWSEIESKTLERSIIVDEVGLLFDLYRCADLAYVGGGFKSRLHNILEPIAHHVFTFFGNEISGYPEAVLCVKNNLGASVEDADTLLGIVKEMESGFRKIGDFSRVINQNLGAGSKVSAYLIKRLEEIVISQ